MESLIVHGMLEDHVLEYLDSELGTQAREKPVYPAFCQSRENALLMAAARRYGPDYPEQYQKIIDEYGYAIVGKFRCSRDRVGGSTHSLERFHRERYEGAEALRLAVRVRAYLAGGDSLWLLVLDPDPPVALWRCRVRAIDANEAGRGSSVAGDAAFALPTFPGLELDAHALIPDYVWLTPERQALRYHCNFWFLVSSFDPVDPALTSEIEDLGLENLITLSTQHTYPCEVAYPATSVKSPGESSRDELRGQSSTKVSQVLNMIRNGLEHVELTEGASRDFLKAPEDIQRQAVSMFLRLDRVRGRLAQLGVSTRQVAGSDDLWEADITGIGRLAIGTGIGSRAVVVAVVYRKHDPNHQWRDIRKRWQEVRNHAGEPVGA